MILRISLLCLTWTLVAWADYGWVPEFQKLQTKVGMTFTKGSENFESDGGRADIKVGSTPADFTETRFWLEPEYGIAEDWAVGLRAQFVSGSVESASSGNTLASGAGLGDTQAWLKYAIKTSYPILTMEGRFKFPNGTASPSATDDLVVGDGNLDAALVLHTGHRVGRVYFSLSPGFLARFGNYAPAVTGEASLRVTFPRGYLRAFMDGIFSLAEEKLNDSSIDVHDALGAGGTYARLAGSPTGITLGGVVGFRFYEQWAFEIGASHGVYGVRYPNNLNVLATLRTEFDFYKTETRKKIREIPLESDGSEKFYDE